MHRRCTTFGSLVILICGIVSAQEPLPSSSCLSDIAPALQVESSLDSLGVSLKGAVLQDLPEDFEFQSKNHWGHQAHVPSLQGLKPITVMRNHGDWDQVSVVARDLPHNLKLRVGEPVCLSDKQVAFRVCITVPAKVQLRKQVWANGLKLYSNSVKARFVLTAEITVVSTAPPEKGSCEGSSLQLVGGLYSCDRFVPEELNGHAADAKSVLETKMKYVYKPWQPAALAEFQRSIEAAVKVGGDNDGVRKDLNKVLVAALAHRQDLLLDADSSFDAREPDRPIIEFEDVNLFDSLTIEFDKREHNKGSSERAHAEHTPAYEHIGLSDHSVKVDHAPPTKGSGSGSGSRRDTSAKK